MAHSSAISSFLNPVNSDKLIRRIAWVIALGVLLNPLNSSMIAVALLRIGDSFDVSVATATWLISGFYIAGAVGPSLAGKLADLFGAKKLFATGLLLVAVSSLFAAWAPNFGTLLAIRIVQALGSTVAFPAGMSILRSAAAKHSSKSGTDGISSSLGLISITANVMAAFGPTLGGLLVGYVSWHAIFWVNIPVALIALIFVRRWLPADDKRRPSESAVPGNPERTSWLKRIDLPGIALFAVMLTALMTFLLSLSERTYWWLLLLSIAAAAAFVIWEKRSRNPFIPIPMLTANKRLLSVYLQFAGLNVVFYALFFSMPLWLDQARGLDPKTTGLLMLPFAGVGVLMTPIAVRLNRRFGYRTTLIAGNLILIAGALLLPLLDEGSPIAVILLVTAVLGVPNGLNNMGLQTALYDVTPPKDTGIASGLFQTFRSIGSVLSTSLLGLIFGGVITSSGLHTIAFISVGLGGALLLASVFTRCGKATDAGK